MTNEQLALLTEYAAMRNAPRDTMGYGVYPNCVKALTDYTALQSWLAEHDDLSADHAAMIAAVAPHIETLQQAMQTIVATMQAIERAAPGTFGIELPEDKPE